MKNKIFIVLILLLVILFVKYIWHFFWNYYTPEILSSLGQFLSGTIGILVTSVFAIIAWTTFRHQVKINNIQKFENSFFKLLTIYERIVDDMDISIHFENQQNKYIYAGKNSFYYLYRRLSEIYYSNGLKIKYLILDKESEPSSDKKNQKILNSIMELIKLFRSEFVNEVDNYFDIIYSIIQYVENQKFLKEQEKQSYINIFKTELSHNEILLIYYDALSLEINKDLIKKFKFIKNIKDDELIDKGDSDHIKLYDHYT